MKQQQLLTYFIDCLGYSELDLINFMTDQGSKNIEQYAIDNDYYNDAVNYINNK